MTVFLPQAPLYHRAHASKRAIASFDSSVLSIDLHHHSGYRVTVDVLHLVISRDFTHHAADRIRHKNMYQHVYPGDTIHQQEIITSILCSTTPHRRRPLVQGGRTPMSTTPTRGLTSLLAKARIYRGKEGATGRGTLQSPRVCTVWPAANPPPPPTALSFHRWIVTATGTMGATAVININIQLSYPDFSY